MFNFMLGIFILGMPQETVGTSLNQVQGIVSKGFDKSNPNISKYLSGQPQGLPLHKFGQIKCKYKGAPDSATYLTANSSWFDTRIGANGFVLVWLSAEMPGGETDTNYQDTVDLKVAEEISNNSVRFYPPAYPSIVPDTNNPVTSVGLNNGEAILWLRDSEAENLILWAIPRDGLKPSHPVPYKIDTSGATATRLKIEGPKKINKITRENDIGGRYLVKVVDNAGDVVTGYGDIIDPTRVRLKVIEENPDGSAKLMDFLTGEGDSVNCGLISGQANVFLSDSMIEKLTLVAESNFGDLLPDTFEIDVLPPAQATVVLPISFSGTYGTRGVDKTILTVAFAPGIDGPDPNNNSSLVELAPTDIMWTPSASISPAGPQVLMGGIASFMLSDNEADSGIIIQTIPSGTPELSAWWFERVAYGFKEPGEAVVLHPSGPSTAIVGDTITLFVYAVDAQDSLDASYDGWVKMDVNEDNGSCVALEYGTGDTLSSDTLDIIIHIQNGIGRVWLTDSEVEEISVQFEDAEGKEGPFGKYLGLFGPPDEGMNISFEFPGDSATHWVLELSESPGNKFPVGFKAIGTIKACDDSGLVDTAFHDTAQFTIGGFAVPSDTNILVEKGIATIEFSDDSVEKVAIGVSGAGLTPCIDSVEFVASGTAVWLVPISQGEILVNDSLKIVAYAMTSEFSIATSWNGVAKVSYSDPGAPSVSWVGNPDSIPITNGLGSIVMLNSEVESVAVKLEYVSGDPPLSPINDSGYIQFEAKLWSEFPDSGSVGAPYDTLIFGTVDVFSSPVQYTAWVQIWCDEENPNGSVALLPDSFQIVDGIGVVEIENVEAETVWVHCFSNDPLIQKHNEFIKPIVFKETGIEEEKLPNKFSFSLGSPNPFTNQAVIHYSLPGECTIYNSRLTIYDLAGRCVHTLVNRKEKPGYYTIKWDSRDSNHKKLASGIYFCKFDAGNYWATKKLILVR